VNQAGVAKPPDKFFARFVYFECFAFSLFTSSKSARPLIQSSAQVILAALDFSRQVA
jgi:hypothetical protein